MRHRITNFSFFEQNSFGDRGLYRELLAIFARTTPVMVSQMQDAILVGDLEQLGKIAHKLKSNVQSVGLDSVYAVLDEVEHGDLVQMNPAHFNNIMEFVYHNCHVAVLEVENELQLTENV